MEIHRPRRPVGKHDQVMGRVGALVEHHAFRVGRPVSPGQRNRQRSRGTGIVTHGS